MLTAPPQSPNFSGGDCFMTGTATVNFQNSLVENGTHCGVTNGVNGNLMGDPNLGLLANNGDRL